MHSYGFFSSSNSHNNVSIKNFHGKRLFYAVREFAPSTARECPVGQTRAIMYHFHSTGKSIRDSSEIIIGPNIDPQGYDRDKCRENCFTHFYGRREFAENARDCPD